MNIDYTIPITGIVQTAAMTYYHTTQTFENQQKFIHNYKFINPMYNLLPLQWCLFFVDYTNHNSTTVVIWNACDYSL